MNRPLRKSHLFAWLTLGPIAIALLVLGLRAAAVRAGALHP